MCGIVGYVGDREAAPLLLFGLKRLEYRGYDSAGAAVQENSGRIHIQKAAGRLKNLIELTDGGRILQGNCGIGHTRWATHGAPLVCNAHPHASVQNRVVMVHNGIIENHRQLRAQLTQQGYAFASDTDTEAAVLLLHSLYTDCAVDAPGARALCAIREMMRRLRGNYAMGILFGDQPGVLYAVRRGSPLVIGLCGHGHMLASDMTALAGEAGRALVMEDMETACITRDGVRLYALGGEALMRESVPVSVSREEVDRGDFAHFMLKEMFEQPRAVQDTLDAYTREGKADLHETGLDHERLGSIKRVLFVGCGSAYHAGLVGAHVVRALCRMRAQAQLASEMDEADLPGGDTLAVLISQSGETADTLCALRNMKRAGAYTLAMVNRRGCAMAREADAALFTRAGTEISVATTKAYSAQLAACYLLAAALAKAKGAAGSKRLEGFMQALFALPKRLEEALGTQDAAKALARRLSASRDVYFIGRGLDYALCMEAALKLKEVSYIHAEAYAAGELKHGTISLIEPGVPVIGVWTREETAGKTASSLAEAGARGALLAAVFAQGFGGDAPAGSICVPAGDELQAASLAVVPLQLLAYYAGCARGIDVDRPRTLAKSVTVE